MADDRRVPLGKTGAVVLAGTAASPFLFIAFLVMFPVTWVSLVNCSGREIEFTSAGGKVLLAEEVTASGEESNLYEVIRVAQLDPRSGAVKAGPWLYKGYEYVGVGRGTLWFAWPQLTGVSVDDGHVVADARTLGDPLPALKGHLLTGARSYHVDAQGRLMIDASDGQRWTLDSLFQLVERPENVYPASPRGGLRLDAPGLRWEGGGRMKLSTASSGSTLLHPQFVYDCMTDSPITARDAWLTAHYDRLSASGGGRGLMLSLVSPEGAELWRWASRRDDSDSEERIVKAMRLEDVIVIQTYVDDLALAAVDASTGKLLWKRGY